MEWVEVTARSLEEAKGQALDRLGVAEGDAEFEVLEEPKQGLFGLTRGEARVRARVRPTAPRAKRDRRERGGERGGDRQGGRRDGRRGDRQRGSRNDSRDSEGGDAGSGSEGSDDRGGRQRRERRPEGRNDRNNRTERSERTDREVVQVAPEVVSETAQKFLSGLVEAFGTTGKVSASIADDEIDVRVDGDDLGLMVGSRGTTLQAIQDLTRVASQRRLGDQETRLRVDIAGYRERRKEALTRFALKVAEEVKASGEARALEPMQSADRKVVHDALVDMPGIVTRSEGEDPRRRVVVDLAD